MATRNIERRLDTSGSLSGAELDASGIPTAFRIWSAGSNPTDHGPTFFTERSAALLLAEQEERGVKYAADINHLSLKPDAPLENQKAVGFYSLEVRDGELWATECEWTSSVRRDLASGGWRYFSPAYDVDVDTGEVVGFLNLGLTNSPATHGIQPITQIAATRMAASRAGSARMTGGGAATMPVDVLRVVASCGDRELEAKAMRELVRRGEQLTDPNTRDGQRLARMREHVGKITHGPSSMSFGALTKSQALAHLEEMKRR